MSKRTPDDNIGVQVQVSAPSWGPPGIERKKSKEKFLRESTKRKKHALKKIEAKWNGRGYGSYYGPIENDAVYRCAKAEYDKLAEKSDMLSFEKGVCFKDSTGFYQCQNKKDLVKLAIDLYRKKFHYANE